ncbi:MAG: FAD-dependent oxidoreductase [Gammaproteobacteria bacterium]|nr:FAD-dependent oxidoreductase [Gammaproteobacteria bacterium]
MSHEKSGLTRRQIIQGTGAVVAGSAVGLSTSCAAEHWDKTTDVLVVGSGIGGATAAFTAHNNGDKTLILEKAGNYGGTTARSAGVIWAPNNFLLRERGINDDKESCLKYMARFSWPQRYNPDDKTLGLSQYDYEMLEAFYDNNSKVVDLMHESGTLKLKEWRGFVGVHDAPPDYLDHADENRVPSGRAIGVSIGENSTGLGAHLMEQMKAALDKIGVPLRLEHEVTSVIVDENNRAIGVVVKHKGNEIRVKANKGVIFTTGGYAHNTEFIANYQRSNLYGACASPHAMGDFIRIAGAAGARMGNLSGAWRAQVVLEQSLANRVIPAGVFIVPGDSMIQVNRYGKRVVNEKRNYNDRSEIHSQYNPSDAEFPNHLLFFIYDQRTAEAFAGAHPVPKKPGDSEYVLQGDTLDGLTNAIQNRLQKHAASIGGFTLDNSFTSNLKETINRYNEFANNGKDLDFQRGDSAYDRAWSKIFAPFNKESGWPENDKPNDSMYPFREKGPYFATILAPGCLDTNGGPLINANAQVLDSHDKPMKGLYGAGNCIASPSGEAYYGAGHTIGLAMTFAYIAANHAHNG